MNFIAKDDSIIDVVQGQVTLIEVADAVDGNIYSISYKDFQVNRQPFYESSTGKQWMVERKYWRKTPLVAPEELMDPEEALQTSLFDIEF